MTISSLVSSLSSQLLTLLRTVSLVTCMSIPNSSTYRHVCSLLLSSPEPTSLALTFWPCFYLNATLSLMMHTKPDLCFCYVSASDLSLCYVVLCAQLIPLSLQPSLQFLINRVCEGLCNVSRMPPGGSHASSEFQPWEILTVCFLHCFLVKNACLRVQCLLTHWSH